MRPDATASDGEECEVMASVDTGLLIIADIYRDNAWLAAPLEDTVAVREWA